MGQEPTLKNNLRWVKAENFFLRLEDTNNEEPMFFAPTKKLLRSEMDPNSAGYFVWSWLLANDVSATYFTGDFKNVDTYSLVFNKASIRDAYVEWYLRVLQKRTFKSDWEYEIYGNDGDLIAWIKNSEHGYYLSSGHLVKNTEAFDLFHWIQTHIKSPVFRLSDRKLYFTDKNEELEFKLAWINETT